MIGTQWAQSTFWRNRTKTDPGRASERRNTRNTRSGIPASRSSSSDGRHGPWWRQATGGPRGTNVEFVLVEAVDLVERVLEVVEVGRLSLGVDAEVEVEVVPEIVVVVLDTVALHPQSRWFL